MREDADLGALAFDLMERARAGDRDASAALMDLLRLCAIAHQFAAADHDWRHASLYSNLGDPEIQAIAQAMRAERARCAGLGRSDPEWLWEQSMEWTEIAAAMGVPGAIVEGLPADPSTPAGRAAHARSQREAFLRVFEESVGPDVLARHASMLSVVTGLRSEAFVLAACHFHPACIADPPAYPLHIVASGTETTRWVDFLQLRMSTPRDRLLIEGQARFILELWNAGRHAELLAPQNSLAPGWR